MSKIMIVVLCLFYGVFGWQAAAEEKPLHAVPLNFSPDATYTYKTVESASRKLELNAFFPERHWQGQPKPAIIFFHGGSWDHGGPGMHYYQAKHLADRGFVAFSASYRLINRSKDNGNSPRECVKDAKSAMRWVRRNAVALNIDPAKVAAAGASAGGHLAAATATLSAFNEPGEDLSVSCKPDALILIESVLDNGPRNWGHAIVEAYWEEISPMHNIKKNKTHPPTLIVISKADAKNKTGVSRRYQKNVQDIGGSCEIYEGADAGPHMATMLGSNIYPTARAISTFLAKHGFIDQEATAEANAAMPNSLMSRDDAEATLLCLKRSLSKEYKRYTLRTIQQRSLTLYTDESLSVVKKIKQIRALHLRSAKITDEGLAYLKEMPELIWVKLSNTGITVEGVAHLLAVPGLERLGLSSCNQETMTQVVENAPKFTALKWLDLSSTSISDADLKQLKLFPVLIHLSLRSCRQVTDKCLQTLAELKGLVWLDLRRCDQVSSEAVAKFKESHPFCVVTI